MNRGMLLAALVGILLAVGLLAGNDFGAVADAVAAVGWGVLGIIAVRAAVVIVCAQGWASLMRPHVQRNNSLYGLLRWIRESVNVLLPVAHVGGDLIGGRLLTFWAVPNGIAGAGILVDLLIQAGAQLLFTLLGLAFLILHGGGDMIVSAVVIGLMVAGPALAGFFLSQKFGLFRLVEKALEAMAAKWPRTAMGSDLNLHDRLQDIYRHPKSVALSLTLHVAAWLVGAAEIWIALACMGRNPSIVEALVLESLGQAIRGAAFPVPGAVGFQEGGYMVLGHVYGLPAEVSIAISLLKRVPDFALGLPGLLAWHLIELRRPSIDGIPSHFRSLGAISDRNADVN
ncbi:TIGR00374 family protein [Paramagnetospirillum kuznetsovii]|uniref:TIGR00374 family protein n=1 Tax=Paramagnetospirillum kuznetsovii TaxID=2053833 RepID=A0A364NTQ2_9PROT|nr:lysylphosphatidylglycerol synthase domain-containing protein [Paramagnetospirillum kuznetsovii]RAU20446.1 TIGR00374 family protein [Paramagnetospirillum kuznetsovii]